MKVGVNFMGHGQILVRRRASHNLQKQLTITSVTAIVCVLVWKNCLEEPLKFELGELTPAL